MLEDLEVKIGEIIQDYEVIPFPNLKENKFVLWESWSFEDFVPKVGF
jgi:hypothetical protein